MLSWVASTLALESPPPPLAMASAASFPPERLLESALWRWSGSLFTVRFRVGPMVRCTSRRLAFATAASARSRVSEPPDRAIEAYSACSVGSPGSTKVPAGTAAPWTFSPVRAVGNVGPIPRARSGLALVPSSQRPSQPELTGVSGTPLCQISIDSKWL